MRPINGGFSQILIGLLFAAVALTSGCNYYVNKTSPQIFSAKPTGVKLDFAFVMSRVLKPHCVECHSVVGGNKGRVNLESYRTVIDNLGDVKLSVEDRSMPKDRPPLTEEERTILLEWIANGAPEFAPEPGTAPDIPSTPPPTATPAPPIPETVDFDSVFKLVIEPKCLKCHSAPDNDGDVNLEIYDEVFKHRVAIAETVRDGSMPKRGTLSAFERELLLKWLQAGAHRDARPTSPLPTDTGEFDPLDPAHIPANPRTAAEIEQLKRGQYIYRAGLCTNCHTVDSKSALAGGLKMKSPFGTFYTPNISPDRRTGIGRWSKRDFKRAMRNGKNRAGEYYYPSFPYTNYSKLKDSDIEDLRVYIMAMPAVSKRNRSHRLDFPYNQRSLLGVWRALNFKRPFGVTEENFQLAEGEFQNIPGRGRTWNRGAYLVEGAFHCTQCHTPRGNLGSLKMDMWMGGAKLPGESVAAGNITPDIATGLGHWREADWIRFLQTATTPDGRNVGGKMRKIVIDSTAKLSLDDQKAITVYLRSLNPVYNDGL